MFSADYNKYKQICVNRNVYWRMPMGHRPTLRVTPQYAVRLFCTIVLIAAMLSFALLSFSADRIEAYELQKVKTSLDFMPHPYLTFQQMRQTVYINPFQKFMKGNILYWTTIFCYFAPFDLLKRKCKIAVQSSHLSFPRTKLSLEWNTWPLICHPKYPFSSTKMRFFPDRAMNLMQLHTPKRITSKSFLRKILLC